MSDKTADEYKAEISALQQANRKLRDQLVRWEIWKQFYGRLMSVRASASDDERVLRQAEIISDMQRRIRGQRSEIKRLIRRDRLAPSASMPTYNVYRHCNKLYNMWLEAKGLSKAK